MSKASRWYRWAWVTTVPDRWLILCSSLRCPWWQKLPSIPFNCYKGQLITSRMCEWYQSCISQVKVLQIMLQMKTYKLEHEIDSIGINWPIDQFLDTVTHCRILNLMFLICIPSTQKLNLPYRSLACLSLIHLDSIHNELSWMSCSRKSANFQHRVGIFEKFMCIRV